MTASELQQEKIRGMAWREIAKGLDRRHAQERETLRIAHACEWADAYRAFMAEGGSDDNK